MQQHPADRRRVDLDGHSHTIAGKTDPSDAS
jgi:hypothetical protein